MNLLNFLCYLSFQGTLHFHLLIFGALSAYAMQQFAAMKEIFTQISKVLDTMFVSEIPPNHHLPSIIHKLAKDPTISMWLPPRSHEVLLSRPDHTVAAGPDGCITHATLQNATYNQSSKQNNHKHLATCHKNFHGKSGYRLFYPHGQTSCTRPVLLDPFQIQTQKKMTLKIPTLYLTFFITVKMSSSVLMMLMKTTSTC